VDDPAIDEQDRHEASGAAVAGVEVAAVVSVMAVE
jgi:hypothetical protein